MKTSVKSLIIVIVAVALGAVGYFAFIAPDSEYNDVNWETYEHTDAYDTRYYLMLDTKEKIAYENIMNEYQSFPDRIEIPDLNDNELKEVFTAILYDNPLLFCFDKTCNILADNSSTFFVPKYSMTKKEYESKLAEIRNLTPEIIANLPAGEFEVELYLHDYLIDRCTYTDTDSAHERDIYGALITGQASCEGYSRAIKYLFDLCDIDTYVLFGSAETEDNSKSNHMWNIVSIDGEYYHLDATWNDTVSQNDEISEHKYMYFNVTDDEISKTHFDFETEDKCTSTDANYYIRKNLYYSTFDEAEKSELVKIITDAVKNNSSSVGIKFETDSLFNNAKSALIDKQEIFVILSRANKNSDVKISTEKFYYRAVEDVRVLEIMFNVG